VPTVEWASPLVRRVVGDVDPYTVTFLWSHGAGVPGVVAMQALAALAGFGFSAATAADCPCSASWSGSSRHCSFRSRSCSASAA